MAANCHPRTDPYVRNYRIQLLPWVMSKRSTHTTDFNVSSPLNYSRVL